MPLPAQRFLDQVQTLAAIEAFEPAGYLEALAEELGAAPTAAAIAPALAAIEPFAVRVMRVRLEHALAAEPSIAAPTQKVFAQTVISYEHDLALLADRARGVAARAGAANPTHVADLVVGAARATLQTSAAIRAGVLALVPPPEPPKEPEPEPPPPTLADLIEID